MRNKANTPVVYVNMLGEFSITINDKKVDDSSDQSKKPWNLLEYLIAFRCREISPQELIELIWGDEDSSNPSGALKTLMFRSRKLLAPLEVSAHSLILQQRGTYAWNKDYTTIVDIDLFEEACDEALFDSTPADLQLSLCLKAIDLYKGDFLPKSSWESWVIPISAYYHTLFIRMIHKTIELLLSANEYQQIIEVCQNAINIEAFDEDLHYYLIYSLFKVGDQHTALEHYNHTITMFYDEFAITPSNRLKDLYKIIQDTNHGIVTDLSLVQNFLHDEGDKHGAFCCEYTVFKDIYQIECRAIERTGDSIYLCLFTISESSGILPKPTILAKSMSELGNVICHSLRKGDVYTRYSVSQYMILLPSATYENCEKVLKRIARNFRKNYPRKDIVVSYSFQALMSH